MVSPVEKNPKAASSPGAALEDCFNSIYRLVSLLKRSNVLASNDLTIDEWVVLNQLERDKECSVRDIAAYSGIPRQALLRTLQQLEKKLLVTVKQPQEDAGTQRAVMITSAGAWVCQEVLKDFERLILARHVIGADPEQSSQRLTMLGKLAGRLARALTGRHADAVVD
jgi:DNA-binding MarR family transcriptional regulator